MPLVKQFQRMRSLEELRDFCAKRGWSVDSAKHDQDHYDHVRVDFAMETVRGSFLFNTFNGRFFGNLKDGTAFDSSSIEHDRCGWFQVLLEAAYTNEPKTEDLCR